MGDEQRSLITEEPSIAGDIRWFRRFFHALGPVLRNEFLWAAGIPLSFFCCALYPYIINTANNPRAAEAKNQALYAGIAICVLYSGLVGTFLVIQVRDRMRKDRQTRE